MAQWQHSVIRQLLFIWVHTGIHTEYLFDILILTVNLVLTLTLHYGGMRRVHTALINDSSLSAVMICHSILFQKCTHHSAADSRQQILLTNI